MSNAPVLHVLIPDLLQTLELWHRDFAFTARSHALLELLSQHQTQVVPFHGLDASLFSLLGFPLETEIPFAFYRAKKEGLNTRLAEHAGSYLCADPVHLKAGSSEVILDTHSLGDVTDIEAEKLLAVLNKHFSQDGLQFVKGKVNNRWYLLLPSDHSIKTTPLCELRGKDISKYLPYSEQINLHRVQNEIQMLLHSAEVNQQREQVGKLAVNSLWFWGGGSKLSARTRVRSVIGGGIHGEVASLVAKCCYLASAAEPEKELQHLPAGGHHILVLDQLSPFALNDDLEGWQQQLDKLEAQWLAPINKLFNKGKLEVLVHSCDGAIFIPLRLNAMQRIWHKLNGKQRSLLELIT